MSQWYEELFTNYAENYDKECFTKGTIGEVNFIEQELSFDKSKLILDVGCGTGRHAIELAKRGYKVVGVDLSETQLNKAKEKAKQEGVTVEFLQKDARNIDFKNKFDLIIMLCEGAFPLMETDEMNFEILKNNSNALKENGKLIFSTLNALYPLYHSVKDFINSDQGTVNSMDNTFDLMTFRGISTIEVEDDLGNKKTLNCNERYYIPSEITWYLKALGFKLIDIFGCKLGEFSRNHKLTTEDFEMLVIAEKQA